MLRQFDDLQDICRRVTSMGRIRETDDLTMAVAICLVKGHRTPPAYTSAVMGGLHNGRIAGVIGHCPRILGNK